MLPAGFGLHNLLFGALLCTLSYTSHGTSKFAGVQVVCHCSGKQVFLSFRFKEQMCDVNRLVPPAVRPLQ